MSDPAPDPQIDGDAETAALFARTASDGPAVDAGALLAEVPRPTPAGRFSPFLTPSRRSFLMKTSALSLTAATLAVAAVWLAPAEARAKVKFQDVQDAVEAERTVAFDSWQELTGEPPGPKHRAYYTEGPVRSRQDYGNRIMIYDLENDRTLRLSRSDGSIIYSEVARPNWNPLADLAKYTATRDAETETVLVDGRELLRFRVRAADPARSGDATVLADPETRLPVRVERTYRRGRGRRVFADFRFGASLAPDLFNTELPARVARELQFEEPGEAGPIGEVLNPVLIPGVGYGAIKLGMSRGDLEAATGVSAFTTGPGEWWFALPVRGVTARGTDADGLLQIYAGSQASYATPFGGAVAVDGPDSTLNESLLPHSGAAAQRRLLGSPEADKPGGDGGSVSLYRSRSLWIVAREGRIVQVSTWSGAVTEVPGFPSDDDAGR